MDSQTLGAVAGVIVVGIVLAVAALLLFVFKQPKQKEEEAQPVADDTPKKAPTAARARTGTTRLRGRMRAGGSNQPQPQRPAPTGSGSDGEAGSGDEDEEEEGPLQPRTRKEAKKEEKEAAREARRAAEEAKQRTSNYDVKRAAKAKEREEKEQAQEAEIRRAAAERQAQEDEEAAKWMNLITVETGGTGESEAQEESQGLLAAFIGYIRERKMVLIEDLAAEFKLRSTEVVDRIQGLESMGRLTGVMDERGKFIYVGPEEMQAVADFIRKRGRVSIAELAAKSSQFIDLEMKEATVVTAVPAMDFDAVLNATEVEAAA